MKYISYDADTVHINAIKSKQNQSFFICRSGIRCAQRTQQVYEIPNGRTHEAPETTQMINDRR